MTVTTTFETYLLDNGEALLDARADAHWSGLERMALDHAREALPDYSVVETVDMEHLHYELLDAPCDCGGDVQHQMWVLAAA